MEGYNHLLVSRLIEERKRLYKKLNDIDIANAMGIAKNTLITVKNGQVEPKANTLYKLAVYLGVTVNDFFDGMPKTSPDKNHSIQEPVPEYRKRNSKDDPWRIAFEQQKEITDLKLQLAHALNESAPGKGANAG